MPITSNALKRYIATIPKVFRPETNRVIFALLQAIALADDDVENSIAISKDNLFIRTATGKELNKLANSLGVDRPITLGLTDTEYQNLIPNLSLKPKVIRKAFYDTADVFWGPLFSRANITSKNFAPFNIVVGTAFTLAIDNKSPQTVKVLTGDIAIPGAATGPEVINILSRFRGATPSILADPVSGNQFINIRTNTPGPSGKVDVQSSTGFTTGSVNVLNKKYTILNLDQRVSIYNFKENELLIEIPSIVPALRRTLLGSHHFHADSTLEEPVAPANGIWQGSFLYNPTGSVDTKTVSSQRAQLASTITKGQIYTSLLVSFTQSFLQPSGNIIFDFGTSKEEGPVFYRGVPNSTTILIDPSYVFKFDHSAGSTINVIYQDLPFIPAKSGKDLAIYLTSPSGARVEVQKILETLKAAGIVLNFVILTPKYKYIIDNPYISTDDAPSVENQDTD